MKIPIIKTISSIVAINTIRLKLTGEDVSNVKLQIHFL